MCRRGFPSNLSIDFQYIAVWVAEEQRTMLPRLVGNRHFEGNAFCRQLSCALMDLVRRHTEGKLQQ